MGMSAGVHKFLVCLNVGRMRTELLQVMRSVTSVVFMAGARRPELYRAALRAVGRCPRAMLIIHHHVRDALCPWRPCAETLRQAIHEGDLQEAQCYKAILTFGRDCVLGENPHNVYRLLTGQRSFWKLLKIGKESLKKRRVLRDTPRRSSSRTARPDGRHSGDLLHLRGTRHTDDGGFLFREDALRTTSTPAQLSRCARQ